jgi:hypothetical protein
MAIHGLLESVFRAALAGQTTGGQMRRAQLRNAADALHTIAARPE